VRVRDLGSRNGTWVGDVRISEAFGVYVDEVVSVPSGTIGRTTSGKVQRAATKAWYERGER